MRVPGEGPESVYRIDDQILRSVTYLYKTAEAAREGSDRGGTGFFVAMIKQPDIYIYAVTAHHVIAKGYSVMRTTTVSGNSTVMERHERDWKQHPDGDDLAVCPLDPGDPNIYGLTVIPVESVVSEEMVRTLDLGPGDEVFMNGRFLRYESPNRDEPNRPFVRFGNIARMPMFLKNDFTGIRQLSFVTEMRSISGYSGSPVFYHIPPFSQRPGKVGLESISKTGLLGVNWGHIRHPEPVVGEDGTGHPDKWRVLSNSSMAGVVPGWKLLELLATEDLVKQRKEQSERAKKEPRSEVVVDLDDSPKPAFTKSDFESALKKASRKFKPRRDSQ